MTILCLLLLALAMIVLPPFRLRARGHNGGGREPALEIRLRPWIGVAGFRLFYADGGWRAGALLGWWAVGASPLTKEEGRKKKRSGGERIGKEPADPDGFPAMVERLARAGVHIKRQWAPLRRSAFRFLNGFRLRSIKCKVTFGASDPAITGQVFGYSMAATSLIGIRAFVDVTPDFTRQRLDGDAELEIWIYPHRLLWAFAWFGWRVGLTWISERRRRERHVQGVVSGGATSC